MAYNVLAKLYDVAVDAGHAGFNKTPGKRTPDGEYEWNFNSIVATSLQRTLEAAGLKVLRVDDPTGRVDVPLRDRVKKANDAKVKIYISVHHNAALGKWGTWTGTETFTDLGLQPGSDILSEYVHEEILKIYNLRDRGEKKEAYYVLANTNMPAVLIEGGFMDSTIDIVKLRDKKLLEKVGEGVAKAACKYLGVKQPSAPAEKPISVNPTTKYFRVRKDWNDPNSQIGAFLDKYGAIQLAKEKEGYEVYDYTGKQVYPVVTPPKEIEWFRVRKSWANVESQLGAFEDEKAAIDLAKSKGYNVYNSKGKKVYPEVVVPAKKTSGVITADVLNVRKGVGTSFDVVTQVRKGATVDILDEKSGWYKILVDDADYAWVSGKYIKDGKIVNCSMLNARSGPSTSNRVLETVEAGRVFKTAGTKDGWVKIVLSPAEYGWISGKYVK